VENASKIDPNFNNLQFPDTGAVVERRSLKYHLQQFKGSRSITDDELNVLFTYYRECFPKGSVPPELNVPMKSKEIHFSVDRIKSCLEKLSLDTGPGYPYCFLYKSKREVLNAEPDNLVSCVIGRLKLYHALDYEDLGYLMPTPLELVLWGLNDFVRVFVKNEPTKTSKIGIRERIINSVSLIQLLVEMYLFEEVDNPKKQTWFHGPGCVGIGFTDAMAEVFTASIASHVLASNRPDLLRTTDVKSMDYSQSEEIIALSPLQKVVTNAAEGTMFSKFAFVNNYVLCRPVYVLSNGEIYTQLYPGGKRSGEYDTSHGNTVSRTSLTFLCAFKFGAVSIQPNDCLALNRSNEIATFIVNAPMQRAQGDDGIDQKYCPDDFMKEFFSEFSMELTGFETGTSSDFLFCSQKWVNGKCIPQNILKQMYHLLSNKVYDEDKLKQYIFDHHNDPDLPRQLEIFRTCWPGHPQRDVPLEDYEQLLKEAFLDTPPGFMSELDFQ